MRLRKKDVPSKESRGTVVHLVGRLTDAVFRFLGPATGTLSESGVHQVVVMIDDARSRELLNRFSSKVEILLARDDVNPLRLWRGLYRLFCSVTDREPIGAVHLHGVLPSLAGVRWAHQRKNLKVPVYFSPHSSKLLGALGVVGAPIMWIVRPMAGLSGQRAIANALSDARHLAPYAERDIELIETPIPDAFFAVERLEARKPLIVGSGIPGSAASVELFAQLAVVLGDEGLGVSFNWIGETDPSSAARLRAANVGVYAPEGDEARASRLGAGWVYVAAGGSGRSFPVALAEAMAAGLPCVAIDNPQHRDLIDDRLNGYLCKHHDEILLRVAALIDSKDLRRTVGQNAWATARERFSHDGFQRRLLAAYSRVDDESASSPPSEHGIPA
ncbi:glycosyltransferase [Methylibium sp.]|uniref:glycosyltransferase n=1 Tax=Methylibium sp. TaxID=2067992 RepID=UPI003D0A7629